MKKYLMIVVCWMLLVPAGYGMAGQGTDGYGTAGEGQAAWKRGDFAGAARAWEKEADAFRAAGQKREQVRVLIRLSEAALALGNSRRAREYLGAVQAIGKALNDPLLELRVRAGWSRLHYHIGEFAKAKELIRACLEPAGSQGAGRELAAYYLHHGHILLAMNQYAAAKESCGRASVLAEKAGAPVIAVNAALGLVRAGLALGDGSATRESLGVLLDRTGRLDNTHDKAFVLVSLGRLATRAELPLLAHEALTAACKTARDIGDTRAYSHGLGALGGLYADRDQPEDAVSLLNQAVFAAHEIDAPDLLYRWQWDLARLYRANGDTDLAIRALQEAVGHISRIRGDLAVDCKRTFQRSFRDAVGPVYFELADLLLKRGAGTKDTARQQADLKAAQATIEQMKKMELQDYFQDDCVIALKARQSALDQEIPGTAVLYPVILPDRLELIVTMAGTMKSFRKEVGRKALTSHVRALRKKIQKPGARFQRYSRKLYTWLIQPVAADLEANHITTLVFVPDGPLRTIPMSALNDGEAYLIEKLAVATTPGLTVTDLSPFRRRGAKILLNGITESVQGFDPLPNVSQELSRIGKLYDSQLLMNRTFVNEAVQENLRTTPYAIVHIASHGQFKKDPDNTFLLTHNGRLTLNRLESLMGLSNFRQEPVELLTLSACQTAVGDDRAALGLAGVAVKSGARCALASLWFINDRATSEMMVDFYTRLRQGEALSKARALQMAQVNLLESKDYTHPAYWAPFLLIGNWL